MGNRDPRMDQYIAEAAEFAQPVLTKLRDLVHEACPEVEETLKWGAPAFEYKGPYAMMVSFKKHCGFGLKKAALLFDDPSQATEAERRLIWGAAGKADENTRITGLDDLPPDEAIIALLQKAKKLNDDGVQVPKSVTAKPEAEVPDDLKTALDANQAAAKCFASFTAVQRREYISWITEAKREATRVSRIETAVEWIAEGKTRNWKYQR